MFSLKMIINIVNCCLQMHDFLFPLQYKMPKGNEIIVFFSLLIRVYGYSSYRNHLSLSVRASNIQLHIHVRIDYIPRPCRNLSKSLLMGALKYFLKSDRWDQMFDIAKFVSAYRPWFIKSK